MKTFVIAITALTISSCSNSNGKVNPEKKTISRDTLKVTYDAIEVSKTSEMLDESKFWGIIDNCDKFTDNQDLYENALIFEIKSLTLKEIIGFELRLFKLLNGIYSSEMWCAAYIINGGCSDDGFEYFRCWVISKGKEVYSQAESNPDYLIRVANHDPGEINEFEAFEQVCPEVFKQKTDKNLFDYIDKDSFEAKNGSKPKIVFNWNENDPETLRKICPKLFEKFWK